MKNLFEQSRSHWVRYDRYELKTAADGKRYITPGKNAKPAEGVLRDGVGGAECGNADDEPQPGGRGAEGHSGICNPLRSAGPDDSAAHHAVLHGL